MFISQSIKNYHLYTNTHNALYSRLPILYGVRYKLIMSDLQYKNVVNPLNNYLYCSNLSHYLINQSYYTGNII